jgi:tripartite-type tricarboxylate transporter receptor subunit TctC
MTIYVAADSPYKTLADLIAAAKAKPVKISISGLGASSHLFAVLLREKAGLANAVVPYPAAQQLLAVIAGDVTAACDTAGGIAGETKIRVLAVASDHGRSPSLPDVPSTGELGYPGLEVINTVGLVAPPGVPADIQKILADAMAKTLADPALLADFKTAKIMTEPKDPVAFKTQVMAGYEALKAVVAMMKKDMP